MDENKKNHDGKENKKKHDGKKILVYLERGTHTSVSAKML